MASESNGNDPRRNGITFRVASESKHANESMANFFFYAIIKIMKFTFINYVPLY